MRLFTRPISSTVANSSKKVVSLAAGSVLRGVRWNYHIRSAVKRDCTHTSTGFKAEILPHNSVLKSSSRWSFIKIALPGNATAAENLDRECQSYLIPGIANSTYFRKMYDVISTGDQEFLALEWLDTTLAEVKYRPDKDIYALIEAFLTAAFEGCVMLDAQGYVNTDFKPSNILLLDIKTGYISAKIGDLGLVFPAGHRFEAQPFAMRAPEVFLGQACNSPSQVWAVAAMLLCWIRPGVLGEWDSPHPLINKAWSMAKIKRLFPEWNIPAPDEVNGESLKAAVKSAARMSRDEPYLQAILPFKDEIQKEELACELKSLLDLILVVDADKRPSASSVLASKEFLKFKNFARMLR